MLKKYAPWLVFAIIIYFPFFLHLDSLTLSIFDEARRGCNALELIQNGNLLVTHYNGEPDMWGTKPPLLIWLQAAFMKILGYNELAVRLPATLAGLVLALYLVLFSKRVLGSLTIGIFSLLVLITSSGFISDHVTRTGDFDALLCLWSTLYLLSFFRFTQENDPQEKNKHLYLFSLFLFLAVLTKGIAGFFFLPGIFIYALASKQVLPLLKNKHLWINVGCVLIGITGFYFLREAFNPGYIETVWNNEIGGRYQNVLEGQGQPPMFYLDLIIEKDFYPWIFTLPFGLIAGYFGSPKQRSLTLLIFINSLVFLYIISTAGTKHFWYNAPIFPTLAILSSFGLTAIFELGYQNLQRKQKNWNKMIYVACFAALFFLMPYYQILNKVYFPERPYHPYDGYAQYLQNHKDDNDYLIGWNGKYNAHTLFYINSRKAEGKNIDSFLTEDKQDIGSKCLLCGSDDLDKFYALHESNVMEVWKDCQLLVVVKHRTE